MFTAARHKTCDNQTDRYTERKIEYQHNNLDFFLDIAVKTKHWSVL